MKEGSGSPTPISTVTSSWFNQRTWRIAGGVAIAGCAVLAFFGSYALGPETPLIFRLVYWGIFCVLIVFTLLMVLLDIRYIRLTYALERREIFHSTIGEESFRNALRNNEGKQSDS